MTNTFKADELSRPQDQDCGLREQNKEQDIVKWASGAL